MKNKTIIILFIVLALFIGIYPLVYAFLEPKYTFLSRKPASVLSNQLWNYSFYIHITMGAIALISGTLQVYLLIFKKKYKYHQAIGLVYVYSAIPAALAGIYIGFYAIGGLTSSIGFILLGLLWYSTTNCGFFALKAGNINKHRRLITYSMALCFAAVTLRLWLPLLYLICGDYILSYRLAAWLCWLPNVIWVFYRYGFVKERA